MKLFRRKNGKFRRTTGGVIPVRPRAAAQPNPEEAKPKNTPDSEGPGRWDRFRATRFFRFFASRRLHFTLAGILFAVTAGWGIWKGYMYLHHSPRFGLAHVEISPTYHVDRETLLAMSGLEYGKNIFSISPAQVRKRIQTHPWVRSVRVTRKLPDTVQIEVTEHEAAAVAAFPEKADCRKEEPCPVPSLAFYLVDREGKVFKRATVEEMRQKVVITGIPRELFGKSPLSVERLLCRSLDLLELWRENPRRPELGEIRLADDIVILVLRTVPCEIHLEISDARRRLEMLDALWDRLDPPLEKTRVIYLDDRENPGRVVVIPEPVPDATPLQENTPP